MRGATSVTVRRGSGIVEQRWGERVNSRVSRIKVRSYVTKVRLTVSTVTVTSTKREDVRECLSDDLTCDFVACFLLSKLCGDCFTSLFLSFTLLDQPSHVIKCLFSTLEPTRS